MRRLAPFIGALIAGGVGVAVAYAFAGNDIGHLGDFRNGALRFIGGAGALGAIVGWYAGARVALGRPITRESFTLSYKPAGPEARGYREMKELAVEDLLVRLRAAGYAPSIETCTALGERTKTVADASQTLVGMNAAIMDPSVRGYVRLQLPPPSETAKRSLGVLEVNSEGGPSAEQL
ncbi:MAG TPA: hypothetical protein VGM39_00735, partial [Kofleriaceae bacterium]